MTGPVRYSNFSTENVYLNAAAALDIPFEKVTGRRDYWLIGNVNQRIHLTGNALGVNSAAATRFAADKAASQSWLQRCGLPVPPFMFRRLNPGSEKALAELKNFAGQYYPVVVKPNALSLGRHVCTDIRTDAELMRVLAYQWHAQQRDLIVEKYIEGQIYRVIAFDDEVIDVARWSLSTVTGNGSLTIRMLIAELNQGERDYKPVDLDLRLVDLLHKQGYRLDSVIEAGTVVRVAETSGRSGCRRTREPISSIPVENLECLIEARRVCGLRLLGIDLICTDITLPWQSQAFYINEVNSSPGMSLSYLGTDESDFAPAERILKKIFHRSAGVSPALIRRATADGGI